MMTIMGAAVNHKMNQKNRRTKEMMNEPEG
jgi:hypothetical protein